MEPRLQPGGRGVFTVTLGNETIFSKHDEGRFPTEKEVIEALKNRPQNA